MGDLYVFLCYFCVVLLHEFAHFYVAKQMGYKTGNISLLPFGMALDLSQNFFCAKDEILISIAGPCLNFILILVNLSLWWCFPSLYVFSEIFVSCNVIICICNLLPCYPLDGGRVLVAILSRKMERVKALKICFIFNYFFSMLFVVLFFTSLKNDINFTYAIMAIFMLVGSIESKFSTKYDFCTLIRRPKPQISELKILYVDCKVPIFKICSKMAKKRYNILAVEFESNKIKFVSERAFQQIIKNFSSCDNFKQILK